jgi:hypothetical protein
MKQQIKLILIGLLSIFALKSNAISLQFSGCGSMSASGNTIKIRCYGNSGTCTTIRSTVFPATGGVHWQVDFSGCDGAQLRFYLVEYPEVSGNEEDGITIIGRDPIY